MNVERMREQYRAMGATEEQIERAGLNKEEALAREGITVYEPNVPAFLLFLGCSKQWDQLLTPKGQLVRTGLRWPDVEARARHIPECRNLNEEDTDRLWRDITTLQNTALQALAEQRDHEG